MRQTSSIFELRTGRSGGGGALMSALDVFRYDGADVRVVVGEDGEPRIVLSDIAKVLGYRDAATAGRSVRDHQKGYAEVRTPGGPQSMLTVTEQGFNRLVLRSNASNADAVQDWVTDEVMPAIRRTGQYISQADPEDDASLVARALQASARMLEQKDAQIAVLTPRAQAWDELADGAGDYEVADAAKILARAGIDVGRTRLFDRLEDMGWIFRGPADKYGPGKWKARQSAVDSGYLAERPQSHHHPRTGLVVIDPPQVRVTIRGLERLRVRLGRLDAPALHAVEGTNA